VCFCFGVDGPGAIHGYSTEGVLVRLVTLLSLGAFACSDYLVHKTDVDAPPGEADTGTIEADPPDESTYPPDREEEAPRDTGESTPPEEPEDDPPPEVEVPTEPVYLHTGSTLYSWDPDSGLLSLIGDFHNEEAAEHMLITDIAIDGDGRFYGVTYEGLYGIDGHTAETWRIVDLTLPLFGLTATSDGRLVGGGDGLYIIDTETGALDTLVPPGTYETSGDLVGLPDGLLYWAVRDGDDLVVVDPNTGASTRRGVIGVGSVFGLGFAGDALYGFTEEGQVLHIDASTGAVLEMGSLPGEWYGATTNPVVW
jgi:hypothetical protein